jgi:hypothetical protein
MKMVTEEEKQEIIDKAVEKALLMLPEVIGNLMAQHVALSKMNSKFYADHPEFRDKKAIVASVIEMVEGNNPNLKYEDLLVKAIPEIQKRIESTRDLDTSVALQVKNRKFDNLGQLGNGEL